MLAGQFIKLCGLRDTRNVITNCCDKLALHMSSVHAKRKVLLFSNLCTFSQLFGHEKLTQKAWGVHQRQSEQLIRHAAQCDGHKLCQIDPEFEFRASALW